MGAKISIVPVKLSAQRNETETKHFQNCFKTVSFQFHFVVRRTVSFTVLISCQLCLRNDPELDMGPCSAPIPIQSITASY